MAVEEHTITLDGVPVFYRSASSASATQSAAAQLPATPVYLHSVPTSSEDWITLLERTGGLAPDLLGFGRSGKGGQLDYTIVSLASFLGRFLEQASVEAASLVLHGWSAPVGLRFARRHPNRVRRIVLCNPVPAYEAVPWDRLGRIWRTRLLGELSMGATTKWVLGRALKRRCAQPQIWSRERVESVWRGFDHGTQRAILRLYRSTEALAGGASGDPVAGVTPVSEIPTLLVWGERDPWLAPALAPGFLARMRQTTYEPVPEAGHWPWLEQPAVAQRIADFVLA